MYIIHEYIDNDMAPCTSVLVERQIRKLYSHFKIIIGKQKRLGEILFQMSLH